MTGFPIWYELMCSDVGAVREFYRATLGWDVPAEGQAMPNGAEYRIISRADGGAAGGVLTISGKMAETGMSSAWFPYFHAPDVDALCTKASELGGTVHLPPTDMPGAGRVAMLSDPQGAMFYLITPKPPADQPDAQSDVFSVDQPGRCRWNELQTTDEPASTQFYKALFGWSADNTMPMGDKGVYRFVEQDGVAIGAINPWMPDYMGVSWLPYFGVTDIEAARQSAKAAGGSITHAVHEVPGGDFIFTATDPAGAHVGFVGPKGA